MARESAAARHPSHTVVRPHACARRSGGTDRGVRVGHDEKHVAGARHRPQRGDDVVVEERDRGEGAGPDDDRVHELDGDVLRVLGRTWRPAPQGGAGSEPASQHQRRDREVRRDLPEDLVLMTHRHAAPSHPGRVLVRERTAGC